MLSLPAQAGFSGTLLGTYVTDDFSQAAATSNSKQFYSAMLMASLDAKERFHVGWSYTSISAASSRTGNNESYAATDMGPAFAFWFGKNRNLNLSGAYNIVSKATFEQTGQALKEWSGTSYWVAAGAELEFMKYIHLGGRVVYCGTSMTDQKVGATASSVSVGRTWVVPMLTISFRKAL
ncbi:MAG: hypothetical protein ACK5P7_10635 [Bdellovibrio sp.]